ncbi:MAG: hypothetical protein E7071_05310 [Bacteroidales bacterium]|nr:hypothetical protein [Bacteroidales bacterium]
MKKWLLLAGIVGIPTLLVSCNSQREMQKEVMQSAAMSRTVPSQLESYAGDINFDYVVDFVPGEFKKNTVMKITPVMEYNDRIVKLEPLYLQGEGVKHSNYTVIPNNKATTYSKPMQVQYRPGMENAVLWAEIETNNAHGTKGVEFEPVVVNPDGIEVWNQEPLMIDGVKYVPVMVQDFINTVPVQQVGCVGCYINFPISQATISNQEAHNATIVKAQKNLKSALTPKGAKISKVVMVISTSPDGSEAGNEELTKERAESAKACFIKDLNLQDSPNAKNANYISESWVTENWDGLYEQLQASNIIAKNEIIKDLQAIKDKNQRSAKLVEYIKKYPIIKNEILPSLRRADCYVFYTVPEYQVEQVVTYAPQFETMVMTPPTDWKALNDLAVMAIQNGKYRKAQKLLESAAVIAKGNAIIYNNMGISCAGQGNTVMATDNFNKAQIRKEAKYNMGLLLMESGEYKKAQNYLNATPDAALAYCQLQCGENREALRTLKQIAKHNANDYYLLAVAAARCNEPNTMGEALQTASHHDKKMKHKAKHDTEFYPYRKTEQYQNAVK